MIKGTGYDVKCLACGGRYHETREAFDDELLPLGNMFYLKDKYRGFGWDAFPETDNIKLADLRCPWCDGPYLQGSRIGKLIDQETGEMLTRSDMRRNISSAQVLAAIEVTGQGAQVIKDPPKKGVSKKSQRKQKR